MMRNNERADLIHFLENEYATKFEEERVYVGFLIRFLRENPEFWQRSTLTGHVTASAWVLHPDRNHALLIHHKGLNRWFQPGGHLESSDMGILEAALREAKEECGLSGLTILSNQIFDLDIHVIPAKKDVPQHLHYDLRYAFLANDDVLNPDFTEVEGVEWVALESLIEDKTVQQSVRRMVLKSR